MFELPQRYSTPFRRLVAFTGVVVSAVVGLPAPVALAISQANEITYVYDDLGRLEAVVDPAATNGIAKYTYDPRGNLLSIARQSVTTTSIIDFQPKTAKRNTSVTIYGAGFSSTPGQNTVKFGGASGTTASVTSATTTQLGVTVPSSGSVDGPLYVSSPSGTFTSSQTFSLDGSAAPTITGVSPAAANAGASVTITGTGFDPAAPRSNNVLVNGIRAQVTAVSSTSLTFTAPPVLTSGHVKVQTAAGEVTSTADFVSPPLNDSSPSVPYNPSLLDLKGRLTLGSPATTTIGTAGRAAVYLFDGVEGQRVFTNINPGSGSTWFYSIIDPFGRKISSGGASQSGGGFLETHPLETTGTYLLLVDPVSNNTGTKTFTVYDVPPDLTASTTIGGQPVSFSIGTPGQGGIATFPANAGQNVNVTFSGVSLTGCWVRIIHPEGWVVSETSLCSNGSVLSATLPDQGTYSVVADPLGARTGNITLTLTGGSLMPQPVAATRAAIKDMLALPPSGVEDWIPQPGHMEAWISGRPPSPFEGLPPLKAADGTTALGGQVLRLDGRPLPGVTLSIGENQAVSDETGRFVIEGLKPGDDVLEIDGGSASSAEAAYGFFEAGVQIASHGTTTLPYTIWMPKLDTENTREIASPTRHRLTLKTPTIPGLKVEIPKGTVITDHDGGVVRELGITPIPLDRPPFPTIGGIRAPLYFTVQPGGATLSKGARVVYPNNRRFMPGTRMEFCYYEPEEDVWEEYGKGTVSKNGSKIVADPGVSFDELTGALQPPPAFANFADLTGNGDADPVDLGTGLFDYRKTDLHLSGPMPISLTRLYRPADTNVYAFGKGMLTTYHSWLSPQGTPPPYQAVDVILPGERRVHFSRISPDPTGTNYKNAVYSSSGTPGPFFDARIRWNDLDSTWVVSLRDGTKYVYGAVDTTLHDIVDRFGNRIVILGSNGTNPWPIRQIVSYPSGRWVNLTYTSSLATTAKDNLGRQVTYSYTNQELRTVLDAKQQAGTQATYTWSTDTDCNPSRVITGVKDPRQITFITNTYGTGCRVTDQTVPTSTGTESYLFSYTVDGQGHITQTQVTDPNENLRVASFDTSGYLTSDVHASGTPNARTFTYEYDPSSHLLQAVVDGFHSRRTEYAYFAGTNDLQSVTRLAGTGSAVTTSYSYEPAFHQLDTVTDPLDHVTNFDYDPAGCLDSVTDAANRTTSFDCNGAGQITSVTDPLTHATQFGYSAHDLVSVTDPLGRITRSFADAGGRVTSTTDPLNHVTRYEYDDLNQLTKITDVAGKAIAFEYDADGNLRFVRDQRGASESTTEFIYNNMNLPSSRIDPLAHAETFAYDDNGNLTLWTDRKSQVIEYQYDQLDRFKFAGFNRTGVGNPSYESTIDYTWDGGNRLTQIADSTTDAGTIVRTFDDLDRLTNEKQVNAPSQGVTYTYNTDDTRATMTAENQTQVVYGYNPAGQLTSLTQGSTSVGLEYFSDGRLQRVTLPSTPALTQTYAYDAAGQISSIAYQRGADPPDDLAYSYDAKGQRIAVNGSYGRTGLPAATSTNAVYDLGNRLTSWDGAAVTNDLNGNMTSQGGLTYSYNARNQLTSVAQGATTLGSYVADGLGRRARRSIAGAVTRPVYDGWNVVQERSSDGSQVTANLLVGLGLDDVFVRSDASQREFLSDALGSTVALADNTGVVQTSYTYEPYGNTTASGSANSSAYQFTSRENDSTGALALYNMRGRSYSPRLSRFLTEDPIQFASGDANPYSYVEDSPVSFRDPLGLERESCGFLAWRCWDDLLGKVGQCLKYAISCVLEDTFERLILPAGAFFGLMFAGGAIIGAGCSTGVMCGLAVAVGLSLGATAGSIGYGYFRKVWEERDTLYDYNDCVDRFPGICSHS